MCNSEKLFSEKPLDFVHILSESAEGSEIWMGFLVHGITMWHQFYDVLGLFIREKQDAVSPVWTIHINVMKILM